MTGPINLDAKIFLRGPFWEAEAHLVRTESPEDHRQLRTLFIDSQKRTVSGQSDLQLPGTMLILCRVHRVKVTLASNREYQWRRRAQTNPRIPAEGGIAQAVADGEFALLLVQANPKTMSSLNSPFSSRNPLTCLNGEIKLPPLNAENDATNRIFKDLVLDPSSDENVKPIFEVHSSGLSISGDYALPWVDQPLSGVYLLTKLFNHLAEPAQPDFSFRLAIDRERLSGEQKQNLLTHWQLFSSTINPRYPLNQIQDIGTTQEWLTLEIPDPLRLPYFFTSHQFENPTDTPPPLEFAPGEFSLILSDRSPYRIDVAPTSLAYVVFQSLRIMRVEEEGEEVLKIEIEAAGDEGVDQGALKYMAQLNVAKGDWAEQIHFSEINLAYDGVSAARQIRADQAKPIPIWDSGAAGEPLNEPILWGSMPLKDGWAQVPFLNLTEQMLIDAGLVTSPETLLQRGESERTQIMRGALSLGNRDEVSLRNHLQEQSWQITVSNFKSVSAEWTLRQIDEEWTPTSINFHGVGPKVILDGCLWLSHEKPTAQNALPELEDWITGVYSLPLETVDSNLNIFPSPVQLKLEDLNIQIRSVTDQVAARQQQNDGAGEDQAADYISAELLDWQFEVNLETEDAQNLADKGVIGSDVLSQAIPQIWRRHPRIPFAQSMPLTQTQEPPNFPAKSRELAPFELPQSSGWKFGSDAKGATQWPSIVSDQLPNTAWSRLADLPLSSLSLPGLVFDPGLDSQHGFEADDFLNMRRQFRYDIPITDEMQALAQLPKVESDPEVTSPLPDDPVPEPPKPLTRETFAEHWLRLSELASLAALDGVDAVSADGDQHQINSLVEPFAWPVELSIDDSAYPGQITVQNRLDDDNADPLVLTRESALKGINGAFTESNGLLKRIDNSGSADSYKVTAGSMSAALQEGRVRDQRGLWRSPSQTQPKFVQTDINLDEGDQVTLTTSLESIPLTLGQNNHPGWALWFKDIPLKENKFEFGTTQSPRAQDINDPEATSRQHNFISGFEWRLGSLEEMGAEQEWVTLFDLTFFPLRFDLLEMTERSISVAELTGRLQLPLTQASEIELEGLTNAVKLRFEQAANPETLTLVAIELVSGMGEWPLALNKGEALDAPRLIWQSVSLDTAVPAIKVDGTVLHFHYFETKWEVPLVEPLVFAGDGAELMRTISLSEESNQYLSPNSIEFNLLLTPSPISTPSEPPIEEDSPVDRLAHSAFLTLDLLVGREDRRAMGATIRYPLIATEAKAKIDSTTLFEDLALVPAATNQSINEQSLQFSWDRLRAVNNDFESFFLLPGMHFNPADVLTPGLLSVTFRAVTGAPNENGALIPSLKLESGYLEVLFESAWGDFLFDSAQNSDNSGGIFNSSAGGVTLGYTAQLQFSAESEPVWREDFLLNGMVEVKSLMSWPLNLLIDDESNEMTLPPFAGSDKESLAHVRHSLKILLNQHELPSNLLQAGEDNLIFNMVAGSTWQFLAVAEHQLTSVALLGDSNAFHIKGQRSWTTLQEIRFVTPTAFAQFLSSLDGSHVFPIRQNLESKMGQGYFHPGFRDPLLSTDGNARLDALPTGTIFVEASAPHWIKEGSFEELTQLDERVGSTTLQFLPVGNQTARLNRLEDFMATADEAPVWQVLAMPFLGRLQQDAELPTVESSQIDHLLTIDPIQYLELVQSSIIQEPVSTLILQLTSRSVDEPVTLKISPFDRAAGRRAPRLDRLSVEENWFRIQNPPLEPRRRQNRLESVIASLPDTPARLSRATALQQAFDSFKPAVPPIAPHSIHVANDLADPIIWRPDQAFTIQTVHDDQDRIGTPFAFHHVALQLIDSPLFPTENDETLRQFVATTLLPIENERTLKLQDEEQSFNNIQPVSFAISPYFSVEFNRPTFDLGVPRLVSIELLSINRSSHQLRPVTSLLREVANSSDPLNQGLSGQITESTLSDFAINWGREVHSRLTPDSPVGIVRLREILRKSETADEPGEPNERQDDDSAIQIRFRFLIIPNLNRPEKITKRVYQMRQSATQLRFRDGRYAGTRMPESVRPFEVAPTQSIGVQPFYLDKEFAPTNDWPWGVSGLRSVVQIGDRKQPAYGSTAELETLWWQGVQHRIQYRSALNQANRRLPTSGLPNFFRAKAIKQLLPTMHTPPLPTKDQLLAASLAGWQPILPGTTRFLSTGNRSGGFMALRHNLTRQNLVGENGIVGERLVSGSIPAQHRVPRPVVLPATDATQPEIALQTWASNFEPTKNSSVTINPADEAYYASCGNQPSRRLHVELKSPPRGEITSNWDGRVTLKYLSQSAEAPKVKWRIIPTLYGAGGIKLKGLSDSETTFVETSADEEDGNALNLATGDLDFTFSNKPPPKLIDKDEDGRAIPDPEPPLSAFLGRLSPGQLSTLSLEVAYIVEDADDKGNPESFQQTLSLPLRMGSSQTIRLPLEPRFIAFEDPEYNRRLSSLAGKAAIQVQELRTLKVEEGNSAELAQGTITLATDRREYNLFGRLAFRFDWDDERLTTHDSDPESPSEKSALLIEMLTADGATIKLKSADFEDENIGNMLLTEDDLKKESSIKAKRHFKQGVLYQLNLEKLVRPDGTRTGFDLPGNRLQFTMYIVVQASASFETQKELVHTVDLVETPVTPVPEAGLALLRSEPNVQDSLAHSVNCCRFAWGPNPTRIELVCDEDLRNEVVRRRAVYIWTDTVRNNITHNYAVQKITYSGSTHFPDF